MKALTDLTKPQLEAKSGAELVTIHNEALAALTDDDSAPVKRFADKKSAVRRTWEKIKQLKKALTTKVPTAEEKPPEAPKRTRARRGTNLAPPGHAPLPCREGSKQAILLDALAKPRGATMEELVDALSGGNRPWQENTVRAGFGWDMKLKGYGVRSEFDADGTERFFIVVPKGHSIPPHRPLKSAPKADARQRRLA